MGFAPSQGLGGSSLTLAANGVSDGTKAAASDDTRLNTDIVAVTGHVRNNPAAAGSAVALVFAGITGPELTLPAAATLIGIGVAFSGTHTAGVCTVRGRKNGTPDSTIQAASGASDTRWRATGTGVVFAAGDSIGGEYDTDGSWNGTSGLLSVVFYLRMSKF